MCCLLNNKMMNRIIVQFGLLLLLTGSFSLSGCFGLGGEGGSTLTEQQEATQYLSSSNTWGGIDRVDILNMPDGVDESVVSALSVTFGSTGTPNFQPNNFRTSGALDVLSAEPDAAWEWVGLENNLIQLTGASSTELTNFLILREEQRIEFTFEVSASANGGKILGLSGQYRVSLQRN